MLELPGPLQVRPFGELDALRDQVSGISLDEEAVNLVKFQKAYEASARFFRAIDSTLDTLLGILR